MSRGEVGNGWSMQIWPRHTSRDGQDQKHIPSDDAKPKRRRSAKSKHPEHQRKRFEKKLIKMVGPKEAAAYFRRSQRQKGTEDA